MHTFRFNYDKEQDDLFMCKAGTKSKGSIEVGDIILDFNSRKELVGIELLNATTLLETMIDKSNVSNMKKFLEHLTSCKVEAKEHAGMLIIKFILISHNTEIEPILSIPTLSKSSPALAYT